MIRDEDNAIETRDVPRLFVFEPGWQIAHKSGSFKEFCYAMAPGTDYYHRLLDGEVYLIRADEKLCIPCAARRGLLAYGPKSLREPLAGANLGIESALESFDVVVRVIDDGE